MSPSVNVTCMKGDIRRGTSHKVWSKLNKWYIMKNHASWMNFDINCWTKNLLCYMFLVMNIITIFQFLSCKILVISEEKKIWRITYTTFSYIAALLLLLENLKLCALQLNELYVFVFIVYNFLSYFPYFVCIWLQS